MEDRPQFVFDHLFSEEAKGDLRTAMRLAGYADSYPIKDFRERYTEELAEATKKFLASEAMSKAAFTLYDGLRTKEGKAMLGEKDRLAAAKDILNRAGLAEVKKVEVTSSSPLFILPAKDDADE